MDKTIRQNLNLKELDSCDLDATWNILKKKIPPVLDDLFPKYDCIPDIAKSNHFETMKLFLALPGDLGKELEKSVSEPLRREEEPKMTKLQGLYQDFTPTIEFVEIEEDSIAEKENPREEPRKPCSKWENFKFLNFIGPFSDFINMSSDEKDDMFRYGETELSADESFPETLRIVFHDAGNFRQVWFQNRRAKWRRQEKMEATRLGLNEYHGVGALGRVAGSSLALPMDPWLAPPLLSALPGFLSHPQTGYPSYLTPPVVADTKLTTVSSLSPTSTTPPDARSTSIAALRLKAKEHVESITKGLQMV